MGYPSMTKTSAYTETKEKTTLTKGKGTAL